MISDRNLSATMVASTVLWVIGGGVIVVDIVTPADLGEAGVWLSCLAGVLTIRRLLCHQLERARDVFEMGRDYERTSSRDLRSIR